MNKRLKIIVTFFVALAVFGIAVYWYSGRKPVSDVTRDVNTSPKQETAQTVEPGNTPESSKGLVYKQIRVPAITTEEFTAPNFVKATPAHKAVVVLTDIREIRLDFSAAIAKQGSRITVFSGNKLIASGGIVPANDKTVVLPFDTSTFSTKTFSTGIYEVFYDACFAGEQCYKGQYAFFGVVP